MKRLLNIFVGVLLVIAVAYSAAWYAVSEKMMQEVDTLLRNNSNLSMENISYTAEKYGFPARIGVSISDFSGDVVNEELAGVVAVTQTGKTSYYTSLFEALMNPEKLHTVSNNISIQLAFTPHDDAQKKKGHIRVDIGRVAGFVNLQTLTQAEMKINELDLYTKIYNQPEEERISTLDEVVYVAQTNFLKEGLVTIMSQIQVNGATFIDPENKDSIRLSKLSFDGGFKNLPFSKLQQVESLLRDMNHSGSAVPVKDALLELVDDLYEMKSHLYVNRFAIETDGLNIDADLTAMVDQNYAPMGEFNLSVVASNALKEALPADMFAELTKTPLGAKILGGKAEMDFKGQIKNGFAVFNGMPLMQIPSLKQFVMLMPNNVSVPKEEPYYPGAYVAPEKPADDLLDYFKEEEKEAAASADVSNTAAVSQTVAQ